MRKLLLATGPAVLLAVAGLWAWDCVQAPSGNMFTEGGLLLALGRLAGLLAACAVLAQLVLVSRAAWLEPVFGLDRLARVHHFVGAAVPLGLLSHPVLVTLAHARKDEVPLLEQFGKILGWEDTAAAAAGMACILTAAALSLPPLRRRLSYERWHAFHLLGYLGLGLALGHQLALGGDIADNPWFGRLWVGLLAFAAANVLGYRFARPLWLSLHHRFAVERVVRETDDVVSVWITGRRLSALRAQPGQFMILRFWAPGLRWQAHPFSLSRPPDGQSLRVSIKRLGDFTAAVQGLSAGVPVIVDGPHGAFTGARARQGKVLLVAGGIGITPLRALAEGFQAAGRDCVLLYGNRARQDAVFVDELAALAGRGGLRVHHVLSAEPDWAGEKGLVDAERIRRLVPDCVERDAFLCGPPPMLRGVLAALRGLGVPEAQLHYELFSLS